MEELSKEYKLELENLKNDIQNSETLELFLENEDEETYKELQNIFEPRIEELYEKIADKNPLQLISLEKELLDENFEGLFLPRILGYSVLRSDLDNLYKNKYPQEHFKDILLTITESPNYENIQSRIGQTVQIGFAISTDIWVTDLFNNIQNKNIKKFFQSQRLIKYHNPEERQKSYERYKKQFDKFNYKTAIFPNDYAELKRYGEVLKDFLLYRATSENDNSTLIPHLYDFLNKKELINEPEFIKVTLLLGMYYQLSDKNFTKLKEVFNTLRKENENFDNDFFEYYLQFVDDKANFKIDAVGNLSKLIDKDIDDEMSKFFKIMDIVYEKG
ncbi:MAG: hypothetical protein R2771_12865 [Saprospiraceae bacterium]